MRISAKVDYALRAVAELAASPGTAPMKAEDIAQAQAIPLKFLLNILNELRRGGIVQSQRGAEGGYRLARSPADVTVADVIRALEGPLANVHESRPEDLTYAGAAASLQEVWIAVRASLRDVLERVTIADLASGDLPDRIRELTAEPGAWRARRA